MLKRLKTAAALLTGAAVIVLFPALRADAAEGNVTLSGDGVLTLSGDLTREQILDYRENYLVTSIVAAPGAVLPENCCQLFNNGYEEEYWDEDDSYWYETTYYWYNVTSIDLSAADASKVTDMSYMFSGIHASSDFESSVFSSYHSINLHGLDTSGVARMSGMFQGCYNLTDLDVGGIDTSAVMAMSCMFFNCRSLTELDLTCFDTSNVIWMDYMFGSETDSTLETITVTDLWSMASVKNSYRMFAYDRNLKGENGTVFDSSKIDAEYARIDMPGQPGYFTEGFGIGKQPDDLNAEADTTVYFKIGASGKNLTYQWQCCNAGTDNWVNSDLTGSKTASLSVPATISRSGMKFRCIVTSGDEREISREALLSVYHTGEIIAQPEDASVPFGSAATFRISAIGSALTYQWQYNSGSGWKNSNAPGAQTDTLTLSNTTSYDGYQYRCRVKAQGAASWYATSDPALLEVLPVIVKSPSGVRVYMGETVELTCEAKGVGLTYQWQYNSGSGWKKSNAIGAQTEKLTMTANENRLNYQYRCAVTGACGKTVYSDSAAVTVETSKFVLSADGVLTIYGKPTKEQIQAYRQNLNVTAVVAAKGMVLPANCAELFWNGQSIYHHEYDEEYYNDYYWYSDLYYWKNVKSIDLSQADASKVTTMRKMFGSYDGRKLDYDYDGEDFLMGRYTLRRFGYSPYTSINLRGLDTSRVKDMSAMFHGCTALTELNLSGISTSAVTTMRKMFCKCTALTALDLRSFDTARVTNMAAMFSGMSAVEAITVSDKWSTAALTEGNDAEMFLKCTALTGGCGTKFDSTKTDSSYARIDKPGQPGYLSGNAQIITQPQNASAAAGKAVTLTVAASGAGLSYQWQYNSGSGWKKSNGIGAQTDTLTLTANVSRSGYQYRCVVTDQYGNTVISDAATVTVAPVILWSPQDVSAEAGSTVYLRCTASGAALTYQWQYNSGSGWKNSNAAGAQTTLLTLTANANRSGYQYRCVVTDQYGTSVISDAAAVTVK